MESREKIITKIKQIDLITSPHTFGKDILYTKKLPRLPMIGQQPQLSNPVIVDLGDLFMDIREVL